MSPNANKNQPSMQSPAYVLAADIGGTKADLGLYSVSPGEHPIEVRTAQLPTASKNSARELLSAFLGEDRQHIAAACAGVAGTVRGTMASAPNLPYDVSAEEIGSACGISAPRRIKVVNDLIATALGIQAVDVDQIVTLQEGEEEPGGTRAVIAAGTGLGEAILIHTNGSYHPIPSEGGHSDLAAADKLQWELVQYLRTIHDGHASYERAVSGPGLENIFRFLVTSGRAVPGNEVLLKMESEPAAAIISTEALCPLTSSSPDPACAAALTLFIELYGAEAGNLALKTLSTGGLYVCGGIAPRIIDALKSGGFLEAFRSKGRMRGLMEKIPVRVVTEPRTALLGALECALTLL